MDVMWGPGGARWDVGAPGAKDQRPLGHSRGVQRGRPDHAADMLVQTEGSTVRLSLPLATFRLHLDWSGRSHVTRSLRCDWPRRCQWGSCCLGLICH